MDIGENDGSTDSISTLLSVEPSATQPQDTSYFKLDSFDQTMLEMHNSFRQSHQCQALNWSNECAVSALTLAEHMAINNTLKTYPTKNYGQNIAFFASINFGTSDVYCVYNSLSEKGVAQYICNLWYNESSHYDYTDTLENNDMNPVGHFTQMIWKDSKELGTARITRDNRTFIVAIYKPPGNIPGQYEHNVLKRHNHEPLD